MHGHSASPNHNLREATRALLSKSAIRLLLSCRDQPAPTTEHRAGGENYRTEQKGDRPAGGDHRTEQKQAAIGWHHALNRGSTPSAADRAGQLAERGWRRLEARKSAS